jgi:hypothetical protein
MNQYFKFKEMAAKFRVEKPSELSFDDLADKD